MPYSFALTHDATKLRIVRMRDVKQLEALILGNRAWLRPWEATLPGAPNSFDIRGMVKGLLKQLERHEGMPFVIEVEGKVVGQLNVANMLYGSVSSATIGYWISPEYAGRGITPTAVALVTDHLFRSVGLHRVEIAIRPENQASLRIVEKLGFRFEGLKERYIHINGDWRDHKIYALTEDEVREGVLNRWLANKKAKHTPLND